MDLTAKIRKLARSFYWQNIYKASKEMHGFFLFSNKENLSSIQASFLYWLRIYDILYNDLANQEHKYLNDNVIEDDIRTDAYLYFRQKENEKKLRELKIQESRSKSKNNKKHKGNVTPFDIDLQR